MHRSVIQRIFRCRNANKTCRQFKCFIPQARYFFQILSRCNFSIFGSKFYNILRYLRANPRNIFQKPFACGIYFNAYLIYRHNHNMIQRLFKFYLIDIMLILTDTNTFWIDFNQLGQWIHQSSCNRHGTTNGYIMIRKFLTTFGRSTINTCSRFINHKQLRRIKRPF